MMRNANSPPEPTTSTQDRWRRLRTRLLTPRNTFGSPATLISVHLFMSVCYILVVISCLSLLLPAPLYLDRTGLLLMAVFSAMTLYAHLVSFNTGKYLVVLVPTCIAILDALFGEVTFASEMLCVVSVVLFLLGDLVIPLRNMIWIGAFQFFGMVLVILLGNQGLIVVQIMMLSFSVVIGLLILLLHYLRNKLVESVIVIPSIANSDDAAAFEPYLDGFSYRSTLKPNQQPTLTAVFGGVQRLLELNPSQIVAQNGWERLIVAADLEIYRRHMVRVLQEGFYSTEYRVISNKVSEPRWLRDNAQVIYQSDQEKVITGTVQDISERVEAENALRAHVVQQAVVAELGLLALSYTELSELADHASTLIEEVLEIGRCEIMRYDVDKQEVVLLTQSDTFSRGVTVLPIADYTAPYQNTLLSGEVSMITIDANSPFKSNLFFQQYGIRQCACVVIQGETAPFGLINIYSTKPQAFADDEVYFLQSVANIISTFVAQHHARKQEHEQLLISTALRESTSLLVTDLDLQTVLDRILEVLDTIIPQHEASTLILVKEKGGVFEFASQRGYDEYLPSLASVAFAPSQTSKYQTMLQDGYAIINDVPNDPDWLIREEFLWIQSYLGAPIIIDGEFVGLINLDSSRKNAFTPAEGLILKSFADKAGLAIKNAQRAQRLESLIEERTNALQGEREQLQAILDATGEGIYYTEHGKIRYANQALFDLTGYTREDLIGKSSTILHPQRDETEHLFLSRSQLMEMARSRTWRSEGQIVRSDSSTVLTALTTSRLDDLFSDSKSMFRAVTVVRDISLQKELEKQHGRFISNAAHELRTPITNLNTRLYLIEKQPEKMPEHVTMLKRVIGRMNRLVSDLLDMAYIENAELPVEMTAITMQDVITETVELLQPEAAHKQIAITLNVLELPTSLVADAHRLQQVFTNLIVNAINYTPNGGSITVTQTVINDKVKVDVKDTGVGIPISNLTSIFEPFYRVETKHTGTGLGLSIAQDIVRLHKGTIDVTSELGKGSTFTVTLPLG